MTRRSSPSRWWHHPHSKRLGTWTGSHWPPCAKYRLNRFAWHHQSKSYLNGTSQTNEFLIMYARIWWWCNVILFLVPSCLRSWTTRTSWSKCRRISTTLRARLWLSSSTPSTISRCVLNADDITYVHELMLPPLELVYAAPCCAAAHGWAHGQVHHVPDAQRHPLSAQQLGSTSRFGAIQHQWFNSLLLNDIA